MKSVAGEMMATKRKTVSRSRKKFGKSKERKAAKSGLSKLVKARRRRKKKK